MEEEKIYGMTTTFKARIREITDMQTIRVVKHRLDECCDLIRLDIQDGNSSQDIALALYEKTDEILAEARQEDASSQAITCARGCCHCCKQAVVITDGEADLLVKTALERGLTIDLAGLRRQNTCTTDEAWLDLPVEDRPCVFLGEQGECRVYDRRPLSCRKYFSVEEPARCDIIKYPAGRVKIWHSFHAETLATAAFTEVGGGYLPGQILRAIERITP